MFDKTAEVMGNTSHHIEKLLLLFGNRIGFILIIGITIALLLVQNTEPAFSEQSVVNEFSPRLIEIQGLTFDPNVFPSIEFESVQALPSSIPTPTIIVPTMTPTPLPEAPEEESMPVAESVSITPAPTSTPEPTMIPVPTETPVPTPTPIDPNNDIIWDQLAACESGGNWQINTGNGYFGGLQFSQGAWNSVGGSGTPSDASREDQIAKGKLLQARRGWGAWGLCAKKLGLN